MRILLFITIFCSGVAGCFAQEAVIIHIPTFELYADRLLSGDADTYGLGDFDLSVELTIEDSLLVVRSNLVFREGANDETVVAGNAEQRYLFERIKACRSCLFTIDQPKGKVIGQNIGARGFQQFDGTGVVQSALLQTDTFGSDVGKIGGTVSLTPIRIEIKCLYAARY